MRGATVTQYLLSIYQPDAPTPDAKTMAGVITRLHVLNEQLQASGAWVFTAGLRWCWLYRPEAGRAPSIGWSCPASRIPPDRRGHPAGVASLAPNLGAV
jgi:hypothetical protein